MPELNLDGIIGPTHNYSGLSFGNLASMQHKSLIANPKEAALQGLKKMHQLMQLGVKQGVLPPQERPYLPLLHALGYSGTMEAILQEVRRDAPELLAACSSAASMWTANAATVSPSADTLDGKVHLTPANLISKLHRSFEAETTAKALKKIFTDPSFFVHHPPLPASPEFADEGAANHTRFCANYEESGVELFVYGRSAFNRSLSSPERFPARQTIEASQAIARRHQLTPSKVLFAQQNPLAIDAGVFHNDVIAVGNKNLFFYHQKAFVDTPAVIEAIGKKVPSEMHFIEVLDSQVTLEEAVSTYLFNSQLLSLPNQEMALIAPLECQLAPNVHHFLEELLFKGNSPIKQIAYVDLRQSMQNGGGPACLRLRVALTESEYASINPSVLLTEDLYQRLVSWVHLHYRDSLAPDDIANPKLVQEVQVALNELTDILQLGALYSFQL